MDQPERYPSLSVPKRGGRSRQPKSPPSAKSSPPDSSTSMPIFGMLKLATLTPAQRLGVFSAKGSLEERKDAELLILDADLKIETVLARGRPMIHQGEVPVKGTFEDWREKARPPITKNGPWLTTETKERMELCFPLLRNEIRN
jgi:hypothetical protein